MHWRGCRWKGGGVRGLRFLGMLGVGCLVGYRVAGTEEVVELPGLTIIAPPALHSGVVGPLGHEMVLDPGGEVGLGEALQRIPGLVLLDSFGGFDPPRLSIRGSGIQSAPSSRGVALFLNGYPLNFADGSFHLALVESDWLETAFVVAGPVAGVPALGGSLSLWTPAARLSDAGLARMRAGSDRLVALSGQDGGKTEAFDWSLAGAVSVREGWRDHSKQRRETFLLTVRRPVSGFSELSFQLFGSRPCFEVPGPLPRHLALRDPTTVIPRVAVDRPRRNTHYLQIGSRLDVRPARSRISVGGSAAFIEDSFFQLLPNGISVTDGLDAALFADFHHDWDSAKGMETEVSFLMQAGWLDTIRYATAGGQKGEMIGRYRLRPVSVTFSAMHRFRLGDRQAVGAGVSVLSGQRTITERRPAPRTSFEPLEREIFRGVKAAPRIYWSWNPTDRVELVVSWARSYEPPTYGDLLFTELAPGSVIPRMGIADLDWQRAESVDVRARGMVGNLNWTTGVYHARWSGEFLRLQDISGASRGTVNADRTVHSGWESSIEWVLGEAFGGRFQFWTTYELSRIRFDGDPVYGDRRLGGLPQHTGAAGMRADMAGGWFLSPSISWQGGRFYADHANTLSASGFAVWSLDLGRAYRDWTIAARASNLFDSRYIASTAGVLDRAQGPAQPIFLPGTGRRLEARVERRW